MAEVLPSSESCIFKPVLDLLELSFLAVSYQVTSIFNPHPNKRNTKENKKCLRSLVVRALERYSKDPGSSPCGGRYTGTI